MFETRSQKSVFYLSIIYVLSGFFQHGVAGSGASEEVQRYLDLGLQMLARGQLQDALAQFHAAIDKDSRNYLSYYRRATVLLALGRGRPALTDLNTVLTLKPEMTSARMQRAGLHLKMGELDLAHVDLEEVLRRQPDHEEASAMYTSLEPLRRDVLEAEHLAERGAYGEAVGVLGRIIDACPWFTWARELRITCHEMVGDLQSAVTDLRVSTKLTLDDTEGRLRLATLQYRMGDVAMCLQEVRECLRLDPDHAQCFKLYKTVKKVNKHLDAAAQHQKAERYDECTTAARKVLKDEPRTEAVRLLAHQHVCACARADPNGALSSCDAYVDAEPLPRAYCDRADVHIALDNLDAALSDFQQAADQDQGFQRAREGVNRVNKLKKQAGRRDYYKILGVKRTASKREITKAYRNAAKTWHPDKYTGPDKEMAQKKFVDIAAAKEVLSDPEMRKKFDAGEDPLDPEAQQRSHGHPFQDGFHPFHHFQGGGFTFHF